MRCCPWARRAAVVLLATALGAGGWGLLQAQAEKPIEADALLPPQTAIYLRWMGANSLKGSFKQTALHQALYDSGFMAMAEPLARRALALALQQANPPEARPTIEMMQKTIEHVFQHGLVLGIDPKVALGEAVLVLPQTKQAGLGKEIDARVRQFIELAGRKVEEQSFEGRKVPVVRVPPILFSWWEQGDDLVVVASMLGPVNVLRRGAGNADGLAKSAKVAKLMEPKSFPLAGRFWLDAEALLSLLPRFSPIPEVLEITGAEALQTLTVAWGYDGTALRTDADVQIKPPRKGLMKLLDLPGIKLEQLPKLPADLDTLAVTSLDGAHVYDTIRTAVRKGVETFAPQELETMDREQKRIEEEIGFKIRDGLAAPLGPMAVLYQSPLDGPLGAFGITLAVGVKDRKALQATVEQIVERMTKADPKFLIERKGYRGADLWIGGYREQGFPLAPTACLTDRWLVFGLFSPAPVLRFVRLQQGEGKAWEPTAEITRILAESKGSACALTYADPRPVARTVATVMPILAGLLRNSFPELNVDLTQLPNLETMTAGLFPGVSVVTVDEHGVHAVSRSSLPVLGPGIGGGGAGTGVLAALLLPAVQQARAAARRTQDANNLKQIALALHNFHDTNRTFPRGTAKQAKDLKVEQRLSWLASILPYVEEQTVYNQLLFNEAWDGPGNKNTTAKAIPVFRSPTAPAGGPENGTGYVGMAGVGKDAATLDKDNAKAGIFGYERETQIRDITDGTSNTIMTIGVNKAIGPWAQGGPSTIRGLGTKPYINGPDGFGTSADGVNVGFADGSVRFISNSIDPRVLEALATKAGGEVVNPP